MNTLMVIDDLFPNKILLKQHMYSAIRSREDDNALKILTTDDLHSRRIGYKSHAQTNNLHILVQVQNISFMHHSIH